MIISLNLEQALYSAPETPHIRAPGGAKLVIGTHTDVLYFSIMGPTFVF